MMYTANSNYTIDELISVCISRQVVNGEVLAQGINTPLVMAGFILAKCTHAPDVSFASAIGQSLCQDWGILGVGRMEEMWLSKGLFHAGFASATAELLPRFHPKEFFRPAQVDAAGNTNNIAFGSDYRKPRMRLPGTGGIPDVTTYSDQVYLYVPRHSRVTFVEQVDFISGLGHVSERRRGNGPRYLVSDLGQFDWYQGRMRLISLHPGVAVEQVQKKTGFKLEVVSDVPETLPPTAEEIYLLRQEIDPLGVRKLEMLGGSARKDLLRAILEAENAW
ncbi:MAG TPA: CoA-transferase [Phototrophicaceae bacterium]|jgi:acyl CoA:acetate/3-ketoacid CoA transferase beta subunit|nr:CoA-transferase [Phototrophicaceae bacterium]